MVKHPDFLEQPRQVTFDWHIVQVTKWLEWDGGRQLDSTLAYASQELRTAIERYIFELFVLLKGGKLSKSEEAKCRSIDGVFAVMSANDKNYRKTARFTEIVAHMHPGAPEVRIVDTRYLHGRWKELSEYCHKHLHPEDSYSSPDREFQKHGFALIAEVLAKFHEWKRESAAGFIDRDSMPPEVAEVYEKYVNDEVDDKQVERMLRLMEPVLRRRQRLVIVAPGTAPSQW